MFQNKQKFALHVTKNAKNNTFENCDIERAKLEGKGTKMIRTRISNDFRKSIQLSFCLLLLARSLY